MAVWLVNCQRLLDFSLSRIGLFGRIDTIECFAQQPHRVLQYRNKRRLYGAVTDHWCVYIVWTESYLLSVKLRYTFFSPTIKIYENAINCKFFFSLGPFCLSSSNGLCVCVCVLGCATAFIVQHWCTNLCAWSSMAFFARYVVSGPLLLAANISNDHRSAELWRCEAFLLFAALAARSIRQKSSLSASKKNQIDDVHMIWADADVYSLCLLHISATATERCETV